MADNAARNPEKKDVIRVITRALFAQRWSSKDNEGGLEARRAAFLEAKPALRKEATKIYKFMKKKNVEMRMAPDDE